MRCRYPEWICMGIHSLNSATLGRSVLVPHLMQILSSVICGIELDDCMWDNSSVNNESCIVGCSGDLCIREIFPYRNCNIEAYGKLFHKIEHHSCTALAFILIIEIPLINNNRDNKSYRNRHHGFHC